jgi:NAD(P)-dependent dehydrogenase (short-subunit alcohol dehydrogenase family)
VEGKKMAKDLLTGKICIITGGTQGLGKGIAFHLAKKGAAGIIICGRNAQNGETSAKEIREVGCPCEYVRADLTREADCRNVVHRCDEKFGRVHGLVNAAGITDRGSLEDTTVELWDRMFSTNVRAPFILTQEAVKIMRRENISGSIVNIISDTSHGGPPYLMAYSTSKGALATLTKNNAHALRFDKIRVNGVNMGWTYTPHEDLVQKGMGKGESWLAEAEAQQPFGRLLRPYDIASLVGYLLSDQAEMVTGSVIDFNQNVIGAWD